MFKIYLALLVLQNTEGRRRRKNTFFFLAYYKKFKLKAKILKTSDATKLEFGIEFRQIYLILE